MQLRDVGSPPSLCQTPQLNHSVIQLQGVEALDEVAAEGAQWRFLGHLAQPALTQALSPVLGQAKHAGTWCAERSQHSRKCMHAHDALHPRRDPAQWIARQACKSTASKGTRALQCKANLMEQSMQRRCLQPLMATSRSASRQMPQQLSSPRGSSNPAMLAACDMSPPIRSWLASLVRRLQEPIPSDEQMSSSLTWPSMPQGHASAFKCHAQGIEPRHVYTKTPDSREPSWPGDNVSLETVKHLKERSRCIGLMPT